MVGTAVDLGAMPSQACSPRLLESRSFKQTALGLVASRRSTDTTLPLRAIHLFLGVNLTKLVAFIMEHLVKVFSACSSILVVLVDKERTHDELVESLEVVSARVLLPLLLHAFASSTGTCFIHRFFSLKLHVIVQKRLMECR